MTSVFDAYRNPDGKTFDGARMLSDLSGLPHGEVSWTFARLKHLMRVEGKSKKEAIAIVREEAKARPWEATKDV